MTDLEDLRVLAPRIPQARRRMYENLPGYGTGGDGPSGKADSEGGRTAALAIRNVMSTNDALADIAALNRLAPGNSVTFLEQCHAAGGRITRQVDQLHRIINRWDLTPEADANLRATADVGSDGCRSCVRVGKWSDIHRRGLCWFCLRITPRVAALYEWDDELPPKGVVEWHHSSGKGNVTDKVIHAVMFGKKRREEAPA